jgi:two-component system nitrogen regulation sensor histidine kinase GlnL
VPGSDELLDSISTSILVFDAKLHLRHLNAAAEYLLSSSAAKAVGTGIRELFTACGPCCDAIERALREGQPVTERALELRLADNSSRMIDCVATPCTSRLAGGNGVVVELLDVSHQHRLQLEEQMNAQSQITDVMLRGLAHEVKNPLGGIRGAAQLLERQLSDPRYSEYIGVIISETDRLRALVDRMVAPGGAVTKQAVNIHTIIERVRQLVAAEINGDIEIQRDYDPSLPPVAADPDLLIQVFLNISRNAVQALQTTGGVVTLRTRAQRKFTLGSQLHRLVIRTDIIDNGPGIDPKLASCIFLPMVSGRADGTGLGLAIANTLIHRQGGLIGYESEPGHTVFSVWLPTEMRG